MKTVVDFIDKVLTNIDDTATIDAVSKDVNSFMKQFSLYPELG